MSTTARKVNFKVVSLQGGISQIIRECPVCRMPHNVMLPTETWRKVAAKRDLFRPPSMTEILVGHPLSVVNFFLDGICQGCWIEADPKGKAAQDIEYAGFLNDAIADVLVIAYENEMAVTAHDVFEGMREVAEAYMKGKKVTSPEQFMGAVERDVEKMLEAMKKQGGVVEENGHYVLVVKR
jgi:hypothetical protein